MEQQTYEKRGYLREDFRLFHLSGAMDEPVDWHYHTFHKIILFLSGRAAYGIEGKSYPLESGDLIVVPSGCIHRPELAPGAPYERVIVYISPEFLRASGTPGCDLESCFTQARMQFRFVLRPGAGRRSFTAALSALEQEQGGQHFGSELMARALFLQFLIGVSRGMAENRLEYVSSSACDEKIVAILQYLSLHLTEELRIDDLAARFYISKYHMMRRFRQETGYSIHGYLTEKRLLLAQRLLAQGASPSAAGEQAGYQDYSTFSRAYKKQFGHGPSADVGRQHDLP